MEMLAFTALVLVVLGTFKFPERASGWLPLTGTFAMAGYRLLPSLSLVYSQMVSFLTRRSVVDEILQTLEGTPVRADPAPMPIHFTRTAGTAHSGVSFPRAKCPRAWADRFSASPRGATLASPVPQRAGQSTLLDLLLGLHAPESGGIYIDGALIRIRQDVEAWRYPRRLRSPGHPTPRWHDPGEHPLRTASRCSPPPRRDRGRSVGPVDPRGSGRRATKR